jgi:creatinine amidohydrolase
MMMKVRPDLAASERISLAKANTTPDLSNIVGGGVNRWRTIGSRSASGVIGNPEATSPEKGEALFDAISTALADKLCNPDLWELQWASETLTDHAEPGLPAR